jgi:hypothetical protein
LGVIPFRNYCSAMRWSVTGLSHPVTSVGMGRPLERHRPFLTAAGAQRAGSPTYSRTLIRAWRSISHKQQTKPRTISSSRVFVEPFPFRGFGILGASRLYVVPCNSTAIARSRGLIALDWYPIRVRMEVRCSVLGEGGVQYPPMPPKTRLATA